ncbi:hypothetical protein TSOC_011750 [Tetrabaena socialis]|uniref:2Fe-2S ferredoxin-type domain-containing protein n=1 Tax=Tetrabaena socialis TaxID=47790 RepID=A0A2J7ZPU8_9CHLO|nr:hypothetical protein TSOC_011750 [Tetrabaena socialis]|eukprot:PNH02272.1 hypothetical protein TSOC_011750 [Tetrabaena socialis]
MNIVSRGANLPAGRQLRSRRGLDRRGSLPPTSASGSETAATTTGSSALLAPSSAPSPARSSPAASAPAEVVTVHFRQEGRSTQARPGEELMEAASRCAADIPTGCLHGSCGVCEVELFRYGPDGQLAGGPVVMRACVARVPRGWARVEVAMMPLDAVWGQDGWDT